MQKKITLVLGQKINIDFFCVELGVAKIHIQVIPIRVSKKIPMPLLVSCYGGKQSQLSWSFVHRLCELLLRSG